MSTEVHLTKAVKLNDSNYHSWAFFTSAFLRSKGFWDHVTGTRPAPAATDVAAVAKDAQEKDMALGFIQMSLEESQQPHIYACTDPKDAWDKLKEVHNQKTSSTRFVAYNALFNVTKKDDESLQALSTRVTHLMQQVKELRPDKFDLDQLDQDLTCMSLIRALLPNMENLAQQLLLKDALTKEIIINAFVQHDITTSAGFKAPEAAFHTSGTSSSSPSSSFSSSSSFRSNQ